MPVCTYQILAGGPFGAPVQFGMIGQQVYHKWECETENVDTFCMLVHTCSTDDGRDDRAFLIDSNGCSIDRFLLSDIEYPENLIAGQEAHVYKFADRDALFFQCQISITIKEPDEECARPICGEARPEGAGSPIGSPPYANTFKVTHSVRSKRDQSVETLDVRTRFSVSSSIDYWEALEDCIFLSNLSFPCLLIYLLLVTSTFLLANIIEKM